MKIETKSQKGFTLIELMVSMMTSAILILSAGIVLVIGQTSWDEAWKKSSLQRDASYAMLRMSRSIQDANSAAVDANGGMTLRIVNGTGNIIKFSRMTGTHNLQYQIGTKQTLINDKVDYLHFDVNAPRHTVTINLGLKQDDAQTYFDSTVMMRNY
jgi:prepilin-type N-terminal cleavage/methylation domain-containing protein